VPTPADDSKSAASQQIQAELASLTSATKAARDSNAELKAKASADLAAQQASAKQTQDRILTAAAAPSPSAVPSAGANSTRAAPTTIAGALGGAQNSTLRQSGSPRVPAPVNAIVSKTTASSTRERLLSSLNQFPAGYGGGDVTLMRRKAKGIRKSAGRALSAGGGTAGVTWAPARDIPRTLQAAIDLRRGIVGGSTPASLNRLPSQPVAEIGTALRSRREVLIWGNQPSRSRDEAPPAAEASVSVAGDSGHSPDLGASGATPSVPRSFSGVSPAGAPSSVPAPADVSSNGSSGGKSGPPGVTGKRPVFSGGGGGRVARRR
jgi:hypothetical protein